MEAAYKPLIESRQSFSDDAASSSSDNSIADEKTLAAPHLEQQQQSHQRKRSWISCLAVPVCVHLCIITAYTFFGLAALRLAISSASHGPNLVYNPAFSATSYRRVAFNTSTSHSAYVAPPSPAVDAAWEALLQYSNIRLSYDEMSAIDPSGARAAQAIELPDGSGYFGGLTALHELHCLKRLYRGLHPDYYFADIGEGERRALLEHNSHCIDMLRQGVMCRGDAAPVTMRWGHAQRIPLGNFSSEHQCVDWGRLMEWSGGRQIERLMEPGWLRHPTLGPVYDEGFENKIGQVDDN